MAGQYAKPRSSPEETRNGQTLPVYRGDSVNASDFDAVSRTPDPERLLRAYESSLATWKMMQEFAGSPDMQPSRAADWNSEFVSSSRRRRRYAELASRIEQIPAFPASGRPAFSPPGTVDFYTSHEALILDYERALVRFDKRTSVPYGLSGHLLWIGERTRHPDHAHIDFAARIGNPVAVKLGPSATADQVLTLVERLNPERQPGRLSLITRFGAARVRELLPEIVRKVSACGAPVLWVCDPMHGNTFTTAQGRKTRRFSDVVSEFQDFLQVHRRLGTHPGGIHLEFTGDDVTECVGGGDDIAFSDLSRRYETTCDPRLNRWQAVDLAFLVAEQWNGAGRGAGTLAP
jgi:3-deoxy-7-phosphoheptulonate synthase